MKPKIVVTAALLAFVAFSIAAIALKEIRAQDVAPAQAATQPNETDRFVAYYFHGSARCPTCNAIEAQATAAFQRHFGPQLGDGRLEWRVANYEAPEYAHFRTDFQLAFQSLVLVEQRDGKVARWKNLADVWQKVHEPEEFERYVVESTSDFMAAKDTP